MSVKRLRGSLASRKALKFLNSIDSIIRRCQRRKPTSLAVQGESFDRGLFGSATGIFVRTRSDTGASGFSGRSLCRPRRARP
jgi:hypothetical protein